MKHFRIPYNNDVHVDLGNGWHASASLVFDHAAVNLTLMYQDPDRVLDTLLFRKQVPTWYPVTDDVFELHWRELARYAEDYVQQQLLAAYERTTREATSHATMAHIHDDRSH